MTKSPPNNKSSAKSSSKERSSKERSSSRQKQVLLGLLVSAFAAIGVYLYVTPWVSTDIDVGFSEEARRKPFLAAEQFLSGFDAQVKTESGLTLLDNLPPTDDMLLVASSRRSLSERRVNQLIEWVQDGGTLLVLASDLFDEEREDKGDRLLNTFGVWLYEGEPEESGELVDEPIDEPKDEPKEKQPETFADVIEALKAPNDNCTDEANAGLTFISIEGEEQDFFVEMSSNRHLYFEDSSDYPYASNDVGAQFVYVPHGQGSLSVLTTLNQWRNRNIGCHDHAHLLRVLTEDASTLWLLFNTDIEPVHRLLWQRWPVAIALTLLWLALWLWRSAYRSSRIEPEAPKERREVMEHIVGMSRFMYQQNEIELLLSGLRKDCFGTKARVTDPDKQQLAQITHWATQLKIDEQQVHWALTANISRDSKELTNAVALLQKIRNLTDTNND